MMITFISGTDTDVGKTYVASLIVRSWLQSGQQVGVYKPVASGCIPGKASEDAQSLWEAAGRPKTLAEVCPQQFELPLAPPVAAAREGRSIDQELLVHGAEIWKSGFDRLLIEGAGGLLSPLADGMLNIDLYNKFPCAELWIVAANRLGTIHQTLATCEAAEHRECKVSAIILNQVSETTDQSAEQNREEIQRYTNIPVIASIEYGAKEFK